jgi:molybdate transport system substrate-binding protein
LDRLPKDERSAILANVRSQEPDDASIVGKLAEGAADAAFVYRTDVASASGRLKAIELPPSLRPDVSDGIAVVRDAPNPRLAHKFVNGLMPGGAGAQLLHQAGFLPPS